MFLEAFLGGARRSLVPVLSSLSERMQKGRAAGSQAEEKDDPGGDDDEWNMGVVFKETDQLLLLFLSSILSSLVSLVAPSDGSSFGCHLVIP